MKKKPAPKRTRLSMKLLWQALHEAEKLNHGIDITGTALLYFVEDKIKQAENK